MTLFSLFNILEINQCLMKGISYYIHALKMHKRMSISNIRFKTAITSNNLDILFEDRKYCGVIGNVALSRYFYGNKIMVNYLQNHQFLQSSIRTHSQVDFTLSIQGAILKRVLQPTSLVLSTMQSIFPNYQNQSFIGIHLRTGGKLSDTPISQAFLNKKQVTNSIHQLAGLSFTHGNIRFFLSTDSSFVRNISQVSFQPIRLVMRQSKVVIVDSQFGNSHNSDQIRYAIADLMLLSSSSHCYGTYGSTFTHVGCGMSGHALEIVGRKYLHFHLLPNSYTEF